VDRFVKRLLLATVVLCATRVAADDVMPVNLQLREQEPGAFLVQWQVPKLIPVEATPMPVLPEFCEPVGERVVTDLETSWVYRQAFRCSDALAGQTVGIRYPFVNTTLSTVVRVSLLAGDEHARILAPGEEHWLLPEGPPDVLRSAQRSVLLGAEHAIDYGVHVALLVVLAVLKSATLIGWFGLGQLGAVIVAAAGVRLEPALGELGVAIAVALLAREALREPNEQRDLAVLTLAAGAVHGLVLANLIDGAMALVGVILGMDATLVVLGAVLSRVVERIPWQRGVTHGVGAAAVALGLGSFFMQPPARSQEGSVLPGLSGDLVNAGSRRVAPSAPDAPVQTFLAIEAFETRLEVLVRLRDVWPASSSVVAIEDQQAVKDAVAETIVSAARVSIDGELRDSLVDRVDFVSVSSQGVLPRLEPRPETFDEALLGVTLVFLTPRTPATVALVWSSFECVPSVPTTVIDPESSQAVLLSAESPRVVWQNELSADPVPTVSVTAVTPRGLPVPVASLPVIALGVLALVKRINGLARVALALAVVVAPFGNIVLALPSSSVPSNAEARRILASMLPNVYRAFEFREESAAYDRLAASVTGDTLTQIYLEHRLSLEMEERGGARARVEAVEVQSVEEVTSAGPGFEAVASWTVGGTVTHFGHRHFRENRYRASVAVVPVDDDWKIRSIEVLEETRVR
jgi:hypothetical protein